MRRAWRLWVALWDHREHPRVLALIRIGVAVVLLADFLTIAALDLVPTLWAPQEAGGIPTVLQRETVPLWYQWLPPTAASAWGLWTGLVLSALALALGCWTRTAAVVLLLLAAQSAQITPLADRGIDLLLRNVLVLLACSGAGETASVDARRRLGTWLAPGEQRVPAWPRHVLVLQLVVMYFTAGLQKTGLPWTPFGGYSALYIILQDPAIAAGPMPWLETLYPLTQLGTAATVLFELGAIGVLAVFYARWTSERPGRLRSWTVRRRPHLWWLGVGVGLHLGIAATMALGIFPWAVLALYPALVHPDEAAGAWARAWGWAQRRRAPRPG